MTITAPSGIEDDDILVAIAVTWTDAAISWPSGFATWGARRAVASPNRVFHLGWKRASSESGNYVWGDTSNNFMLGVMGVVKGCVASGDPADALSDTTYTTSDTTIRAASITPSVECALLWIGCVRDEGVVTKPGAFTLISAFEGDADMRITLAYKLEQAAEATGTVDGTTAYAITSKHAYMVALEPVAAGLSIPVAMHHYRSMRG